jgi:argininosuccinate lyase
MSAGSLVFIESNTTGTGELCIQRARERGFRVRFLTARPQFYQFLSRRLVLPEIVDTADVDAICEHLAGDTDVCGVMSTSEYFIDAAARVAARRSLPGPDPDAVQICRDKALLARTLTKAGVPAPETFAFDSPAAIEQFAPTLRYPVVLKPISGSGSVGVRLIANARELLEFGAALLKPDRRDRVPVASHVLVQDYIAGEEFSVELFGLDSGAHILGYTRKHLGRVPFFVETGHDFPARIGARAQAALRDLVTRALDAVGYRVGPAHVECRVGADGHPMIIEINPRLPGGMIPQVIELATGVDLLGGLIDFSAGRKLDLSPSRSRHAGIRFFVAPRAGVIEAIHAPPPPSDVVQLSFVATHPVGAGVDDPRGDYRDRLAYVIATSDDPAALDRALRAALESGGVQLGEPTTQKGGGRIRAILCPEALDIVRPLPRPDERIATLDRLAAIDEAHLLMLVHAGILTTRAAAPVLKGIAALRAERYAEIADRRAPRGVYALYEQTLIARLGADVAGVVHTARSRNDINACAFKLELREQFSVGFRSLWRLRAALLGKAADTVAVIMPVYSQFQPGQPGTLAYYLWSVATALERDQQALLDLVTELQVCPLGACAGAGTDFAIRPHVSASLLGFSHSHVSALDAVASRDLGLRLLAVWAICSTTASRLAQDLQLWTMADVRLLDLPDELAGGSSLMPQKKNPYLLEIVKGKLVSLPSALNFSMHAMQKTPFSNSVEVGTEGVSGCAEAAGAFADSCDLLRMMVEGMRPRADRGEKAARAGAVIATQVVNTLVRDQQLSFHEAHRLVGSQIADAIEADRDPLAALAATSERLFEGLGAAAQALRYGGGPGIVATQLANAQESLRRMSDEFTAQTVAWADADHARVCAVEALIAEAG